MNTITFRSGSAMQLASDALVRGMQLIDRMASGSKRIKPARSPASASASVLASDVHVDASQLLARHAHGAPSASCIEDAARVRELATRYQDSNPGFAADLRAAADRHELEG